VKDTRHFAKDLVRELATPHIMRRLLKPGIQNFVRVKAQCYFGKFGYFCLVTHTVKPVYTVCPKTHGIIILVLIPVVRGAMVQIL
jgi:hypothetical protein